MARGRNNLNERAPSLPFMGRVGRNATGVGQREAAPGASG